MKAESPGIEIESERGGRLLDGGRLVWGLTILFVGVLCWLYEDGRITFLTLLRFWPILLVAHGFGKLIDAGRARRSGGGLVLLALGGLLLLDNFWVVAIGSTWPLLLVAAGVAIVGRATSPDFAGRRRRRRCGRRYRAAWQEVSDG